MGEGAFQGNAVLVADTIIAYHLVGNRRAVGGKVLGAAPGHAVRPNHHAAALGADLFRFHGYRAFEGLAGCDGELAAVYGEIQPCGAAAKGIVPQYTVGICKCGRILFSIPFGVFDTAPAP